MKATSAQIAEAIIIRHALNDGDILTTASQLGTILEGFGIDTRDIRKGLPPTRWKEMRDADKAGEVGK